MSWTRAPGERSSGPASSMASSGWYTSGRPVTVPIGVANVIPASGTAIPIPTSVMASSSACCSAAGMGALTLAIQIAAERLGAAEIA